MGVCFCCSWRNRNKIDSDLQGLQHGLNANHAHEIDNTSQEITTQDMNAVESTSSATDHPIQGDDDVELDQHHLRLILHRMQRRKNLKSYLTEIKRSKQQCITKKKKLKQLLLDQ
eukprot:355421_1